MGTVNPMVPSPPLSGCGAGRVPSTIAAVTPPATSTAVTTATAPRARGRRGPRPPRPLAPRRHRQVHRLAGGHVDVDRLFDARRRAPAQRMRTRLDVGRIARRPPIDLERRARRPRREPDATDFALEVLQVGARFVD